MDITAAVGVNPHIFVERCKEMLKAARVSLLILLLAFSAQAGYMPNGSETPAPTPTPQPTEVAEEESATKETNDDVTVILAEAALSVLTSLLALL
ncbi:MAG TPA: hypothetical protein VF659_04000 [Pyrinomonadaceae bacterium]